MAESTLLRDILASNDPRIIASEKLLSVTDQSSLSEAIIYAIENIVRVQLELRKASIIEDEDHISDRIVEMLHCLCFSVTREENNSGNVDITIVWGQFRWLAEAKIFRDNAVLLQGFRQLATRYASVSSLGNSYGGYLIYNFKPDTSARLKEYRDSSKSILEKEFTDFSTMDCSNSQPQFDTKHRDKSTGFEFTIRHLPFSFFHEPMDKSARNSKSSAADKAKKRLKKLQERRGE